MPNEIVELTNKFVREPEKILVQKENLTLDGIIQFYINVKHSDWKYDTLIDIYETINVSQCIIYINSKNRLIDICNGLKDKRISC